MTEIILLFGIALSGLMLVDPFFYGSLAVSAVAKAEVIVFVFAPVILHFAGRVVGDIERWRRSVRAVVAAWWPAAALGTLIILGSVYARYQGKIEETFLNFGIGVLCLPLIALAIDSSAQKSFFLKGLAAVYVVISVSMYPIAGFHLNTLHEQIFIAVPLGVYILLSRNMGVVKLFTGLALIVGCAVSFKNTTFLLIVISIAAWLAVVVARVARRSGGDKLLAFILYYLGLLVVCAALCGAMALWWIHRNDLPDGNTVYRLEMYRIAFDKFKSSPIWGNAFTGAAVAYFALYKVAVGTNYLPTHSDVLDLLANGGVIALALWLLVVWRILKLVWAAFEQVTRPAAGDNDERWRWLFVIGLVELGAIVTYAVNPPLNRLVFGLWIWGGAGAMWALHRSIVEAPSTPEKQLPRIFGVRNGRYAARYQ